MINNTTAIVMTLLLSGCNVASWSHRNAKQARPPLPMNVSCDDVIDHLNNQSGNLKAWQCTDVRLTVRFPGPPWSQRMKGNIACEYPNRFHLTASNTFAFADMGANSERCWFQSRPGDHHGVISWRHEDSHLLQQIPSPVPYIDPDWLMLVLGVKQLDPEDYVLEPTSSDPHHKELWLSSVRQAPGHDSHRYVIKVDRETRVVREHVAFDKNGAPIVRAHLSDHQRYDGHLLPRKVRLELPGNDLELTLSFDRIVTNPSIDTALWVVPSVPNGENIDLGDMISGMHRENAQRRQAKQNSASTISFGAPEFKPIGGAIQTAGTEPDWTMDGESVEPDWSSSADTTSPFRDAEGDEPRQRRFLGLFPVPRLFRR